MPLSSVVTVLGVSSSPPGKLLWLKKNAVLSAAGMTEGVMSLTSDVRGQRPPVLVAAQSQRDDRPRGWGSLMGGWSKKLEPG